MAIAVASVIVLATGCSSSDSTTTEESVATDAGATDILAEATRITDLAKAGLVWAATDTGVDSTGIVAQTGWNGPTDAVSKIEEGKNVQVIICSSGTACEVQLQRSQMQLSQLQFPTWQLTQNLQQLVKPAL